METSPQPASTSNEPETSTQYRPLFNYKEIAAPKGSSVLRCNTRAKLEASRVTMQGVMVRLPVKLRQRIEAQTAGALSVTLCVLAEYALERLEAENKGLVVEVVPELKA